MLCWRWWTYDKTHPLYDVLPLGNSQLLPPCDQRSRSTGRPQERKDVKRKQRSPSLGRTATAPLVAESATATQEDLRQCQESLRRAQKDIKILKGKLLELAEENRQLRSEECKRCQQQAGYSLVPDSLLKEIERALLIFKHLIPVGKHTENRNPVETVAARHDVQVPGQVLQKESVPSSSKGSVADPSAPKPPKCVQSKAKHIVSESSGTADLTSSTARNKQAYRKHTTSSVEPEEVSQPRSKLSNTSDMETSKRLSELLGIDQIPSKLMPSTVGSPDFFPMETLDGDAGSWKYDLNASAALSEGGEKLRATSQKPNSTESTFTNSSHDSTLVSSIPEKVVSTSSAAASYKQTPAAVVSAADHHSQKSDTVSLSSMPSRSFEIHTADITVSSIHSSTKPRTGSKISLRHSQQRHSTPTLSYSRSQGAFEGISTPSNVSLSQNQSEVSTPSTPDTATPPQLAGSDFDGF